MGRLIPIYNKNFRTKFFVSIFSLAMSLVVFACIQLTPTQNQDTYPQSTPEPILLAEIFFWVEIPINSLESEAIQLVILDEVTGLPYNQKRIDMVQIDPTHYGVAYQVRLGSVINYRYERKNEGFHQEYSAGGEPVRYRLFLANNPGEVHDIVAQWSDTPPPQFTGRIIGNLVDQSTGQPIPNVLLLAGGSNTLTTSDGSFILSPIIEGQHNLVAYSLDGSYLPHQQIAIIAPYSATPVTLELQPTKQTNVTFVVTPPEDTAEGIPIRMPGNLLQLGNTFSDLGGNISGLVTRMPQLIPIGDGRYTITMKLPAGVDIHYKYTTGDGFWNAEHGTDNSFTIRQLIIPENNQPLLVDDSIPKWQSGGLSSVWFDVTVPAHTPIDENIYIQFKLFGWMAPLPMWSVGENRWAYQLISPTNIGEGLTYRYCRKGQCSGQYDLGVEETTTERRIDLNINTIITDDIVTGWRYLSPQPTPATVLPNEIFPRENNFVAGIALIPEYYPNWESILPNAMATIKNMNSNTVVFTPTWSLTSNAPPIFFEQKIGKDASWSEITRDIGAAQSQGLQVALFPQIDLPGDPDVWWRGVEANEAWWQVWFERYRKFIFHYADLAEKTGVETLILGGVWLSPTLPGGTRSDNLSASQPGNINAIWEGILMDIRHHFSRTVAWYLPYEQLANPPSFLSQVNQVYIQLGTPLTNSPEATLADLQAKISLILDEEVKPLQESIQKPIILSIAFPSAKGGVTYCLPSKDPDISCLPIEALSPYLPDNSGITLDLQEQVEVYNAILACVNERQWVNGIISEGFLPTLKLEDKSISIHGKPAQEVLRYWLGYFIGN